LTCRCCKCSAPTTASPSRTTTAPCARRSRGACCSSTRDSARCCPCWSSSSASPTRGDPCPGWIPRPNSASSSACCAGSCVAPIERLAMPASVQAVLAARIDRLPEREKQVLQAAAVIGKEFAEPILLAAAELPDGELRASLATLKAHEFVYEQALYPVAEYAFKHPLTQEVALG